MNSKTVRLQLIAFLTIVLTGWAGAASASTHVINLSNKGAQLGFDDMTYSPSLHRVLVPAAQSGVLAFINPANQAVTEWRHVVPGGEGPDHDDAGTTSADSGDGMVFVNDHQDEAVVALNEHTGRPVARAKLAGGPDIVRYVAPLQQVWVTEPGIHEIQRFKATGGAHPSLKPLGSIAVPNGPELLVVDSAHHAIYTDQRPGNTLKISLHSLKVVAEWPNTCERDQGLALAKAQNLLFVACREGKVVALDTSKNGKLVTSKKVGPGVDLIAWNPVLRHVYAPGSKSATMSVLKLNRHDQLRLVATVPTAKHAHCVASDNKHHAYVCDPQNGAIISYRDRSSSN